MRGDKCLHNVDDDEDDDQRQKKVEQYRLSRVLRDDVPVAGGGERGEAPVHRADEEDREPAVVRDEPDGADPQRHDDGQERQLRVDQLLGPCTARGGFEIQRLIVVNESSEKKKSEPREVFFLPALWTRSSCAPCPATLAHL